jgi:hypothetical protein
MMLSLIVTTAPKLFDGAPVTHSECASAYLRLDRSFPSLLLRLPAGLD